MGPEIVGEVVEAARELAGVRTGDLVVSPFTASCGGWFLCTHELPARCVEGQLFGWVERGRGLHGAQAELVRVPPADTTLVRLPAALVPEAALLLADVLPTGYHCAVMAGAGPGVVCAVLGCGPVGLMAGPPPRQPGAERVPPLHAGPPRPDPPPPLRAPPPP